MPLRMVRIDRVSLGQGVSFRWSSIFAGAFATLGFGLFFLLLGNAVGLSIANTVNPAVGGALRFWSWIYVAATFVFSYFLGSFVSTRSNDIVSLAAGGLQGVISWGLASTIGMALAVMESPTALHVIQGVGPGSGNWLAICIIGLGLPSAILGGMSGKEAVRYTRVEQEKIQRAA